MPTEPMKYKDYSADDLIKDEFFQQWVFSPTDESNRFWLDFLENYPAHREKVEEARQFLSYFHVKEKDVFEARVGNLKRRINHSVDEPLPPVEQPPKATEQSSPKIVPPKKNTLQIIVIVSVFIVGLLVLLYALLPDRSQPSTPVQTSENEQVVFAIRGKRNMVTLPDGTKVWLNAESQIIYQKNMDSLRNRRVVLQGEAFFQVSENLQKPFIVQVGEVNITGYAASFNVKAYGSTNIVEAIVVAGRVRMEHKDQPLNKTTISPEQSATFDVTTHSMTVDNNVNALLSSAWREGVLYFQDQPFSQITKSLERWYDVRIHLEDSASQSCHFTGELNNKTLRETLTLFIHDKPASFVVNGSDVIIKGKLCE